MSAATSQHRLREHMAGGARPVTADTSTLKSATNRREERDGGLSLSAGGCNDAHSKRRRRELRSREVNELQYGQLHVAVLHVPKETF